MRFAAVDIGSNAIRCQISQAIEYMGTLQFKKVEYMRFPFRLGEDVFLDKEISKAKEEKLYKLFKALKLLFDLFDVDDYMICATSAMRESKNGRDIADKVKKETGMEINIIDGLKEAELINQVLIHTLQNNNYLHIDVGGGSTELNLYSKKEKILSESFHLGSVRILKNKADQNSWEEIHDWITKNILGKYKNIISIGTGGNINKIFDLSGKKVRKPLAISEIEKIQSLISNHTLEERIRILKLNSDRADVIVPALKIYVSAMKWAESTKMLIPDIGLKDGIIQELYNRNMSKAI